MSDLWIAIAVMIAIAAGLGWLTTSIAPRRRQPQMLWIALSLTFTFVLLAYTAGQLYWARWIFDSAVIVWSNLSPLFAAIAAGICWRLEDTPRWRRLFMALSLASLSVASAFWPFLNLGLRPQPNGGDTWNGPVAMQTSWATCSPAAAATFLTAAEMPIAERDMIPRCLTDASGTPTLGLYRGVKLVAQQNGRDVKVGDFELDQLLSGQVKFPVLLMVRLPLSGVDDPRYAAEWGWIPGMGHSVVALGQTENGGLAIADPAKGMEAWSKADMKVLWHGDAIQLTDR
ncbi:peptidase C39 [Planctomycetes bacterium K23_9]|uniref:Peptidase C39 family protein n=1 Tax=Stieleria marina TaxID=1930275 RepID=A0A517NX09_9BACT|nr:hypothetical protein K239x_36650 [Planctomycetes bacterium K23_9]